MTFAKSKNNVPKALVFKTKSSSVNFIVQGQGVLLFETNELQSTITLYNKDKSDGLIVKFTDKAVTIEKISNKDKYLDPKNTKGLTKKSGASYWFSLDAQNQRLQAGVGEARIGTMIYSYQFPNDKTWDLNKAFLESLVSIDVSDDVNPLRLLRDPITTSIPYKIKPTDKLSMDDIAQGTYLPSANLSTINQKLYNCVSGTAFVLDTPDFPDFSKAIEYSINTPGLYCNTTLKAKAGEFGKGSDPKETYLRITLGENNGESPGIPYVMEIWPIGHFSPVHNHGSANAVIRVLNGTINVSMFPYLCDEKGGVEPFGVADFVKDDVVWISPTLNQIHQLKNLETSSTSCITIQCYMYDVEDKSHYDYFDYIDEDGNKKQYEPDSDMDFVKFKDTIKQEWINRPKTLFQRLLCLK
jgi:hypothetical protein